MLHDVRVADEHAVSRKPTDVPTAHREGQPRENSMPARGTILLVDDEPFILSAVGGVLRQSGFDVRTCEMWAGVANTVRTEEPDVVLLDYNMPMVKGDEICRILKRNIEGGHMKIILFSSEPESAISRISEDCGADGYIRKNTPGPVLVSMLDTLICRDSTLA
jgi:DNA-binding response OmpR family regulator